MLTQQSMVGGGGVGDEYGKSGYLSIFTSLYLKTLF